MTSNQIQPHKITKPIQLLGAWIAGLILTDSIFLYSATSFEVASWERGALVLASILNVPGFLYALFVLQTKFRAELQEDSFYHEYINRKTATPVRLDKDSVQDHRIAEIEKMVKNSLSGGYLPSSDGNGTSKSPDWSAWPIGLNDLHPEFKAIRESLRLNNIPVKVIFGSPFDSKPPKKWIIAINPELPLENKIQLLRATTPYHFDGFEFHHPIREVNETEDVYIGAYGHSNYSAITEELVEMLKGDIEEVDLEYYYKRNKIRPEK